ncbi:GGDEF domain-containing protein [Vibrio ponticus]|uniref:diguanylate cyclase n=1 Tax=Vibrio ponticus TaxID=265668 RepID=A0A3N3DSR4_9VIBR|nr:GGDEF domain-containing protein [Vibrio ponticus]ROV57533.1 GGDEF domain-containing protein [Vibrio ponticus]
MRALFNNQITHELSRSALKFSVVPILALAPVFALQIELESVYDYILEVTRLYFVIILASLTERIADSKIIRLGLALAIFNGTYDAITEIMYFERIVSNRYPFADALLDEAILIIAYGCIIIGLYNHLSQINTLSLTDNLTQCYTRSALKLIPKNSYQLFYLDLDKFKQINDVQGHNIGDRVLTIFGRRLIRCCDDLGYAFRVGGDEFIAIVDLEKAESFINTFTQACKIENIQFSYGTALCEDNNFDKAIRDADENLYEMKKFKDSQYPYNFQV